MLRSQRSKYQYATQSKLTSTINSQRSGFSQGQTCPLVFKKPVSSGKITKNQKPSTGYCSKQSSPKRFETALSQSTNIHEEIVGAGYTRLTVTPSFGNFVSNSSDAQIQLIQQKYQKLMNEYEGKKDKDTKLQLQNPINCGLRQSFGENCDVITKPAQRHLKILRDNFQNKTIQKQLSMDKETSANISELKGNKKTKINEIYPTFFKALKNQIILQQKLKAAKNCVVSENKNQIEKILVNEFSLPGDILKISEEEFDPFETKTNQGLSLTEQVNKIVKAYKQCQQNWKQNVCILNQKSCVEIFNELNYEKSGQISLKSFVRELSFILEKHFRLRDLWKVYCRLAPMTKSNFIEVLKK